MQLKRVTKFWFSPASQAEISPPPPWPSPLLPQRPPAARSPPDGLLPPTPGGLGSDGGQHAFPRSHSCCPVQQRPKSLRMRGKDPGTTERSPAPLPGSKCTLTRLRFRIGGRRGQKAGSGGLNEDDWLRCPSVLLMNQSWCTRYRASPRARGVQLSQGLLLNFPPFPVPEPRAALRSWRLQNKPGFALTATSRPRSLFVGKGATARVLEEGVFLSVRI